MKININYEDYIKSKFKKYTSLAFVFFLIFSIYITYKFLIQKSNIGLWFITLILFGFIGCIYVLYSMKKIQNKEPYIILYNDELICNFKQIPTKNGSLKRKFIGTYESIQENCNLNVVTHYEITNNHIVAYGYSNKNIRELTGFVIERFFSNEDEKKIIYWLENHISNIHDSKIQYLLR